MIRLYEWGKHIGKRGDFRNSEMAAAIWHSGQIDKCKFLSLTLYAVHVGDLLTQLGYQPSDVKTAEGGRQFPYMEHLQMLSFVARELMNVWQTSAASSFPIAS